MAQKRTRQPQKTTSVMNLIAKEGAGLLLLVGAIIMMASLVTYNASDPSFNTSGPTGAIANAGGRVGAFMADILLQYFAMAAFLFPLMILYHAVQLMRQRPMQDIVVRLITFPIMLVMATILLQLWSPLPHWPIENSIGNGGLVGKVATSLSLPMLGLFGTLCLAITICFLSTMWWSGLTMADLVRYSQWSLKMLRYWGTLVVRMAKRIRFKRALQIDLPLPAPKVKTATKATAKVERMAPTLAKKPERVEKEKQTSLPLDLNDNFMLPPLHLLDDNVDRTEGESEDALQQNARQIETQLLNFGVEGKVTKICPGPVITIYELEPAAGVKTSQIVSLSDDLARAMSATAIRIAPIPGRNVIGVEMPNRKRQTVTLKDLLETEAFETHPGRLTVAVGVDTSGNPTYADIATMPHALIAGTTGSGKSVAMNAFILSLLYRMSPEELRFVMIDPKMLELSVYNDIPHLLTPVIIDPHKASAALKWVVKEMENRYKLMTELSVKNIQSFNTKFTEMKEKGEIPTRMVQTGFDPNTGQPTMEEQELCQNPLPYIVVVIDELADLMMVAGKEVEKSIARIAQMARAAGIHLLIATQRPSVDVITGLIKANIPTRFSFNVTSKIDSRTVLDSMGAEQLLGKGDMLCMANGSNNLERMHGAFVSEDECNSVSAHLREQARSSYVDDIFTAQSDQNGGESASAGSVSDDDPLYRQAIELVAKEQKASTSFIQRHLSIGYNRAATLIEKMEGDGLVGPANHVGKREVIVKQPPAGGYE